MTSEVTQAALEPCPFCGGKAEWKDDPNICGVPFGLVVDHKPDCFLAMPMSEEAMLAAWNTRLTAQSGEGRSGAGEDDMSKMSVEMAELFGLVCKMERLKLQRDELMRTDVGFAMIERAADMMDEIVDSVPELKAAFAKVHAREASYRAALNARQSGEGERGQ